MNEALRLRVCDFMKKNVPPWLWVTPEARDFIFPAALRRAFEAAAAEPCDRDFAELLRKLN